MATQIGIYSAVFLGVVGFILIGESQGNGDIDLSSLQNVVHTDPTQIGSAADSVSVDRVIAAKTAASLAQTAGLPIANNVANLSQSLDAESLLVKTQPSLVAKPAIVQPRTVGRTVLAHEVKEGESIDAVAAQYEVSVQTIQWANNLKTKQIETGKKLRIPPVNGVIYKIKDGDTVDSIAEKYKVDKKQLVAYNDLELGGITKDREIILPNGELPANERPDYVAPRAPTRRYARSSGGNPAVNSSGTVAGGTARSNIYRATAGNRYAFGNCTWYAFERRAQLGRPVGSFWGNAATWSIYGARAGYKVGKQPAPGAIMQNGGGYGHVAIVESIEPGVSVTISEMNGYRWGGGFNRVGQGKILWRDATSGYYNYIY